MAYPSQPPELAAVLDSACARAAAHGIPGLHSWRENDIPGRFLSEPILEHITDCHYLVADITRLNFNVTFEVGFAIGLSRRAVLVANRSLHSNADLSSKIGIFDTIGYVEYSNSDEFLKQLENVDPTQIIRFSPDKFDRDAPVYIVLPRHKGDAEIRLIGRMKKAKIPYRVYDPEEEGRMSAQRAIDNVASSHGVAVHLLPSNRVDSFEHNIRAAFVAGLATAMGRELLLLQAGADPVPLDYRDFVSGYTSTAGFDSLIADFAPQIVERLLKPGSPREAKPAGLLARTTFGASAAENEFRNLGAYYLPIDNYYRCKRGEVQLVAGRKGSGKTALFFQLRDDLRRIRNRVVLDLKPEGFQLVKLKDQVLSLLEDGSKSHTVTAFWEYLLLTEICRKVLVDDERIHLTNHALYEPYRSLADAYDINADIVEGDFSERMTALIDAVTEKLAEMGFAPGGEVIRLSTPQITELIHRHDLQNIREHLFEYLEQKDAVWILFDNLDKGWPPHGLSESDYLVLRCLLEAFQKLEREMAKKDIEAHGIVFIRNDIYELLVSGSPDRGKIAYALLDWDDQDALREMIRKRIDYSNVGTGPTFLDTWRLIFASHIDGEETSQFLIDRCLMRPRALIDLASACRSHAVNRGHGKIEVDDIRAGEATFSNEIIRNISFELQDIFPECADILYAFIEAPHVLSEEEVLARLRDFLKTEARVMRSYELLLWYGFIGIAEADEEHRFIYDLGYSSSKMKAYIDRLRRENRLSLAINPAFWVGLDIQ